MVTIAAGSYFLAQTVSTYVAALLGGEIKAQMRRSGPVTRLAKEVPEKGDYEMIAVRNIFNSAQEGLGEDSGGTTVGAGDQILDPQATAVKTALPIKVLGVLVIGEGEDRRSSATISGGSGAGGVDVYFVGDTEKRFAEGTKMVRVSKNRVEFINGGRLEYAELEDISAKLSIFQSPDEVHGGGKAGGPALAAAHEKEGVEEARGRFTIDQREVDEALANLDKLYTEVRIVPNFKAGKPSGLKILSIKPGSLFSKLGMQRGDVLERINGIEMDIKRGMEIFSQLKDSKNLTIDLERNGKGRTLEYEIR
ncbi:MAG: hypothetical protein HYS22_01835 [Deltaproteobacteria bacterium]|nr:hypothetical protein [Deltaproteobacteria bacterium]